MQKDQKGSGKIETIDARRGGLTEELDDLIDDIRPVMWELEPDNLCNDQGILQSKSLISLVNSAFQQPRADEGFVLFADRTANLSASSLCWR